MSSIDPDANRLIALMRQFDRVVIAFSGGVDSSVVAAAAVRSQVDHAVAVTGDSPSVPRWQIELAERIAGEIGIEHQIVKTDEGDLREYRRNDVRRCFHCKQTLYRTLTEIADRYTGSTIVSGTNADDLGDYRPGLEAGRNLQVKTPLADLGFGKLQVRTIAKSFGLSNQDLPASPCLASRIAYGTEVTPARLMRIEQAEAWLRQRGFMQLRVRLHGDELARIEVPRDQLAKLLELDQSGELTGVLRSLGFAYVTIDLQGFESGSLNRVVVSLNAKSVPAGAKGVMH